MLTEYTRGASSLADDWAETGLASTVTAVNAISAMTAGRQ
jgi:hypothetical protein